MTGKGAKAWRLRGKQYYKVMSKDEETAKSSLNSREMKTEDLLEEDGIEGELESLTGHVFRRASGIGSGSTRNYVRFLIFLDIWGERYLTLMCVHHFLTVICRRKQELTQQLVVRWPQGSKASALKHLTKYT